MSIKYYVDISGNYMGAFEGTHGVDVSAWTEVVSPPTYAWDTWNGSSWDSHADPDPDDTHVLYTGSAGTDDELAIIIDGTNIVSSGMTIADISGGALGDGDYGDVTVSSSGTVITVDNGLAATKLADGSVSNTEFQYLGSVTSDIQTQLNSKSTVTPAALTKTDDTNVTLTLGGTPATALLQATSITAGWTGTLSIARGGTGKSTVPVDTFAYSFYGGL